MSTRKSLLAIAGFLVVMLHFTPTVSATTAYDQWALSKNLTGLPGSNTDPAFDADPDQDGIKNGLEWILGGNPTQSDAAAILPQISVTGGSILQSFTREESSTAETILSIEYGSDFNWSRAAVIGESSTPPDGNGVVVTVNTGATPDSVTVNIPAAGNVAGGRLFTRLRAALLGPPASIVIATGNQQNGTVSQTLPLPLRVTIKDEFGNPLSNVVVQWTVALGNGTLSSASSTTNAQGVAICELTLGPDPGSNMVTATVAGHSLSTTFTSTGDWDADANSYFARVAALNGGTDPIVAAEKRNVNAFIVGLKNLNLWTTLADGWSFRSLQNVGTGITAAALKTGAANATYVNGPLWSSDGVVVDGTDKYLNIPPIDPLVTSFTVIQVLRYRIFRSNTSSSGLSWVARNSSTGYKFQGFGICVNSAIPTDPSWAIFRLGADSPVATYNRPPVLNTFYNVAAVAGSATPTTVNFYLNGSSNGTGMVPNVTYSGDPAGRFATSNFGYRIGGFSSPGNNDGMDGTVSSSFAFSAQLSDTQIASVHSLVRSTIGQNLGLPASAPQPPRAGTPSQVIAHAGFDQSAPPNRPLPVPLTVYVKDSLGNATPNAAINWTVDVAGAVLSTSSSTTSAEGLASTSLTLGSSPGAYIVTAQLNGSPLTSAFNATASVPANATLTISSGNEQTGIVSTSLAGDETSSMNPLVVILRDVSGNPLPRVKIDWQVSQGEGTLISSAVGRQGETTPSSASTVTDAAGLASIGLIMGDLPGPQMVLATVSGGSQSVSFNATAQLAAGTHVVLVQTHGAVGDGIVDDQAAIQSALNEAMSHPRSRVVFERNKIYRLVARPTGFSHLYLNFGPPRALSLIGNGATLRSDVDVNQPGFTGASIVSGFRKWQGASNADPVVIHGFTFESTHGITDRQTSGISMSSVEQINGIKFIKIWGNTFKNFSRHVDIGGSQNVTIAQNSFFMQNGADSGSNATNQASPTVGIWMYPWTSSYSSPVFTKHTYVTNNFYDGFSGPGLPAQALGHRKACGDGLVFGASVNYVVTGNRVVNFSYEGIYINYGQYEDINLSYTVPLAEQTATVTDNYLDGGKGQVNENYGVRADYNNTLIERNTMLNISNIGIQVARETYNPPYTSGVNVLNNSISMVDNALVRPGGPQGMNISNSNSVRIRGNTVRVPPAKAGVTNWGIVAGGAGYHVGDGSVYHPADDLRLEDNVIQMKSEGDGAVGGISRGIEIWNLTSPFVVLGNQVSDSDQGLYLKETVPPDYTRAGYEAVNQFLRCIKNVHQ
jgi:hypothetical protein